MESDTEGREGERKDAELVYVLGTKHDLAQSSNFCKLFVGDPGIVCQIVQVVLQ